MQLRKGKTKRLLESNVRAFLGQTGKFNKGIRDTIREKPQMFLPYNNGITATAETVDVSVINNQNYITKLNDFQIVNGGQTTASLYHTQKKYKDADLSKIFVQMKLTVIKDQDQKNVEVPNISRFANSQNKVSELDLSSNNPFFVKIETLSRRKYVTNPENRNQPLLWFFERANGQYRETLNKQTPTQQKQFKTQSPAGLKFVKSDVAKYINLWEQEPHFVSQGSQKNFIHYTKKINDLVKKNKLPGENFYKKLIANAILFKAVDKLFGRKGVDAIGDTNLKSFTVAYTISFFNYLTDNRLDLWRVYDEQKINDNLQQVFKELLSFVIHQLTTLANNSLISEYAKRQSSWLSIKEVGYALNEVLIQEYLITIQERDERENEKEIDANNIEDSIYLNSEIRKLGLKFWDGFKYYVDKNKELRFDYYKVFDIVKKLKEDKSFDSLDISLGKRVLDFIEKNPDLIEGIKALSKEEDKELLDLKFVYDKLLLISKSDWNRIIDIGVHTKIFDNLELANVKSVMNSILKKELAKDQAILKAFTSIKKTEKFIKK